MNKLKALIGKKATLVTVSQLSSVLNVELLECFRNNTLLVSCSEMKGVKIGHKYQIRFVENNVTYSYHVKIARVCNESSLCLQLILPGQQHRAERVPVDKKQIKIILQDGKQQIPVTVADISVDGARLLSTTRLGKINDIFNIELIMSDEGRSIRLPCKIRYVRTEPGDKQSINELCFHHGVEFLQLDANVENFLFRFVS